MNALGWGTSFKCFFLIIKLDDDLLRCGTKLLSDEIVENV